MSPPILQVQLPPWTWRWVAEGVSPSSKLWRVRILLRESMPGGGQRGGWWCPRRRVPWWEVLQHKPGGVCPYQAHDRHTDTQGWAVTEEPSSWLMTKLFCFSFYSTLVKTNLSISPQPAAADKQVSQSIGKDRQESERPIKGTLPLRANCGKKLGLLYSSHCCQRHEEAMTGKRGGAFVQRSPNLCDLWICMFPVMSKEYHSALVSGAWSKAFGERKVKPVNYLPALWIFLPSGMMPVVSSFEKTWKTGNEQKGAFWNSSPTRCRDNINLSILSGMHHDK